MDMTWGGGRGSCAFQGMSLAQSAEQLWDLLVGYDGETTEPESLLLSTLIYSFLAYYLCCRSFASCNSILAPCYVLLVVKGVTNYTVWVYSVVRYTRQVSTWLDVNISHLPMVGKIDNLITVMWNEVNPRKRKDYTALEIDILETDVLLK